MQNSSTNRSRTMKVQDFFRENPVFRHEAFVTFLGANGSHRKKTREALLAYHVDAGHLIRVRRSLYAVVSDGISSENHLVDPYLAVPFPKVLRTNQDAMFGVETHKQAGGKVQVTSLERTMVDVLVRPDLGGGWEEVWRSLESVEYFNLDQVTDYVMMLKSATAAAKVGFFLEQHREALMVDETQLDLLRKHVPKQPCYLDRGRRESGKLVSSWRLVVPPTVLERNWEEGA